MATHYKSCAQPIGFAEVVKTFDLGAKLSSSLSLSGGRGEEIPMARRSKTLRA